MKRRKFHLAASANKFAANVGMKAKKGEKTKLKDGRTANWYSFVKTGKKKKK